MTSAMLQEPVQTSPSGSGPRFRPYASSTHHVTKGRYITSNDPRGYIPVYEYPLNGQWIMMDIDDGYILWTGIWKALGNSKADIVKMIDSQPDLAPLIRRVRGGYLKIQGTWMPYEVALKLSRRVAWMIRDDLVPLFGPTFPDTCLSPDQPGYGQVVPSGQGRRRARRSTASSVMQLPRGPVGNAGWTVVTPSPSIPSIQNTGHNSMPTLRPVNPTHSDYGMGSPYPPHMRVHSSSDSHLHSPATSSADLGQNHRHGPMPHESGSGSRYASGSYSSTHPPTSYRSPSNSLSLDIRSLSMREHASDSKLQESFKLPPIHAPTGSDPGDSPYALPPISVMEDVRGSSAQDSAAVLRRLRMEDDDYPRPGRSDNDQAWSRRHSLSVHPSSKPLDTSPRFQPYASPRSYQDHPVHRSRSTSGASHTSHHGHHIPRADSRPVWSDASHEGDSTSNPSPTSPNTPGSLSENDDERQQYSQNHYSSAMIRGKPPYAGFAGRLGGSGTQHWSPSSNSHADTHGGRISEPETYTHRRNSYEVQSDGDSHRPHRPW
ncbi:hypothetical protein D9613_008142 [Agrocybe pediades]|uniref:HTH APSES-type domain-containing protein n=1 Tax=Agrocybe pediades TaxID=84607 RepID=A0A8H4QNY0_9AGAR|nr:hypothetical protein D9613_008142 [Agrocybe pediades]KAF9554572.1 hypothetical protein CPC08DRAFT_172355 [Agrocybe pediades]